MQESKFNQIWTEAYCDLIGHSVLTEAPTSGQAKTIGVRIKELEVQVNNNRNFNRIQKNEYIRVLRAYRKQYAPYMNELANANTEKHLQDYITYYKNMGYSKFPKSPRDYYGQSDPFGPLKQLYHRVMGPIDDVMDFVAGGAIKKRVME